MFVRFTRLPVVRSAERLKFVENELVCNTDGAVRTGNVVIVPVQFIACAS